MFRCAYLSIHISLRTRELVLVWKKAQRGARFSSLSGSHTSGPAELSPRTFVRPPKTVSETLNSTKGFHSFLPFLFPCHIVFSTSEVSIFTFFLQRLLPIRTLARTCDRHRQDLITEVFARINNFFFPSHIRRGGRGGNARGTWEIKLLSKLHKSKGALRQHFERKITNSPALFFLLSNKFPAPNERLPTVRSEDQGNSKSSEIVMYLIIVPKSKPDHILRFRKWWVRQRRSRL